MFPQSPSRNWSHLFLIAMVLEATMICIDNLEWARSGDYPPSRLWSQADAVYRICSDKTRSNPKNTVGILTIGGKAVRVLVTPTSDLGKIIACMRGGLFLSTLFWVQYPALCQGESNPFGDTCSQDGNAYISFGQWVGAIILYTYVFQMLALPPGETYDSIAEGKFPTKAPISSPAPAYVPLQDPEELKTAEVDSSVRRRIITIACYLVQKLKLKQIFQPPILASILAIVFGVIPFLKKLVLTDDAPLYFFTDSCLILGEAMIPCILLALGGNLIDGPGVGSSRLGFRTTAAIIFARLLLVPLAGLGIVTLADKLGLFPRGNKMFKFVLLLQHSMPTSVLSGAVSNLRGCGKESAAILFWVHIFAVFSMAAWISLYLTLLF